jgi:leucyl aminopeptidase
MHDSLVKSAKGAVPLHAVKADALKRWLPTRGKRERAWLESSGFAAKEGEMALVPSASGGVAAAVLGLGKGTDKLALAQFAESLPQGSYALGDVAEGFGGANGVLAWILGTYQFTRYRKSPKKFPKLAVPQDVDAEEVSRIAEGVFLARDLINTPANDMGPEELGQAARDLAKKHGAKIALTIGDDLLKKNYPLIHTVGRASVRSPRLRRSSRWLARAYASTPAVSTSKAPRAC